MVSSAPPKLREDLTVRQQRSDNGIFFIIKDPVSGAFFRLREAEGYIVSQFDGDTPLDVVQARVRERFGAGLSAETLKGFAVSLEKSGLLETGIALSRSPAGKPGRLGGNLFYLRYKLIDPSRLFALLEPWVGFFYTPFFVVCAGLSILFAAAVAVSEAGAMVRDLASLFTPSVAVLFVVLSFLTVSLHEFAHGLTCRRFGGEVREIGFLLIYFQPALYCNVSDAWLFPEKSKRLWVGFSGPYFEMFLWSIAVLVWRITDSGSLIHLAALIVALSSGIKTLFNFNPFIKLDGYYLLSDALEIPNLRKKSFRYVGAALRRLAGLSYEVPETSSRRERWIYLSYGLVASVTSIGLMLYAVMAALRFVIGGGAEALPAAVIVAFATLRLRDWVRRLFGSKSRSTSSDDDESGEAESSSVQVREERRSDSKSRIRWGKRLRRLAWVTALAGGAFYLAGRQADHRVFGSFRAQPSKSTEVRASVEGIIDQVYVDEGDQVKAGGRIARLSDRDLRSALDRNTAEIREAQAKLRMLEAGPSTHEVGVAQAAVRSAQEMAIYAQQRYDRTKSLIEERVLARNKLDEMREMVVTTTGNLEEARARLNAVLNSVRPEQIEATRAQIERLETERAYIDAQMDMLEILTPVAGIVGTPSLQLRDLRRQLIKKGDVVARVLDARAMTAEISIPEREIAAVKVGQPVELMVHAYPGVPVRATVVAISVAAVSELAGSQLALPWASSSSQKPGTLLVRAELDQNPLVLSPGMTGQAKISCGRRTLAALLTWRAARVLNTEFWSWL